MRSLFGALVVLLSSCATTGAVSDDARLDDSARETAAKKSGRECGVDAPGDLILTNNAVLSAPGTTNINAGRIFFTSQNAIGAGVININNGGTLDYLTGGALSITNTVNIASGGNIASRPNTLTVPNAVLPTTGMTPGITSK